MTCGGETHFIEKVPTAGCGSTAAAGADCPAAQIFKPKVDERYRADHLVSHSDMRIQSEVVSFAAEILEKLDCRAEVIGIDEVSSSM